MCIRDRLLDQVELFGGHLHGKPLSGDGRWVRNGGKAAERERFKTAAASQARRALRSGPSEAREDRSKTAFARLEAKAIDQPNRTARLERSVCCLLYTSIPHADDKLASRRVRKRHEGFDVFLALGGERLLQLQRL